MALRGTNFYELFGQEIPLDKVGKIGLASNRAGLDESLD